MLNHFYSTDEVLQFLDLHDLEANDFQTLIRSSLSTDTSMLDLISSF